MSSKVKKKLSKQSLPPIQEVRFSKKDMEYLQPGTRSYKMGPCRILLSQMPGSGMYHMSISTTFRDPTWHEIAKAWYTLVPDAGNRQAAMILPKLEHYINLHEFCYQVHELPAGALPDTEPAEMPRMAGMLGMAIEALAGQMAPTALVGGVPDRDNPRPTYSYIDDKQREMTPEEWQRLRDIGPRRLGREEEGGG